MTTRTFDIWHHNPDDPDDWDDEIDPYGELVRARKYHGIGKPLPIHVTNESPLNLAELLGLHLRGALALGADLSAGLYYMTTVDRQDHNRLIQSGFVAVGDDGEIAW